MWSAIRPRCEWQGEGRARGRVRWGCTVRRDSSGSASVPEQRCKVLPSYSHIHGAVDDDICKYGVTGGEDMSLVSHGCACMQGGAAAAASATRRRQGSHTSATPPAPLSTAFCLTCGGGGAGGQLTAQEQGQQRHPRCLACRKGHGRLRIVGKRT